MYAISQRSALMIKKVLVVPGGYINITLVNDYFSFGTRTIDTHRKISFLSLSLSFLFLYSSLTRLKRGELCQLLFCFP